MFYALFDWEYSKEALMKKSNAHLYSIGLKNTKFNMLRFWSFILYGWIQSFCVFVVAFGVPAGLLLEPYCEVGMELPFKLCQFTTYESGRTFSLWPSGQNVFFTCLCLANLRILALASTFTFWGELLMALQIASYFGLLYFENMTPEFF